MKRREIEQVATVSFVDIRLAVQIDATNGRATWPTLNAIAGVAAAAVEALGHGVGAVMVSEAGVIEQYEDSPIVPARSEGTPNKDAPENG